jgi:DNA-binding NarL/FixJ family response regulator
MKRGLPLCLVCEGEVPFDDRMVVSGSDRFDQILCVHQRCAAHLAADLLQALCVDENRPPARTVSAQVQYRAGLTAREMEALRCMARGYTNRQIAQELGVAPKTARNMVSEILSKLDAINRVEAVAIATREGLLD